MNSTSLEAEKTAELATSSWVPKRLSGFWFSAHTHLCEHQNLDFDFLERNQMVLFPST